MMTLNETASLAIRPATPEDAELAARLMYLSMGELAEYLFGGVRASVDEILAGLFRLKESRFSWCRADVAEWAGQPVGMTISFSGRETLRRNLVTGAGLLKICGLRDVIHLAVRALSIAAGIESKRDEYYLANMAVLPEYQGHGIGSSLLTHVEEKAREAGSQICSLIVDTENPNARRLYERFGYQIVFTKTYLGSAEDAHAGYHRMVKELV
jgi:ribosomal protein S18 acetylase RimI-like enzyme